ncbi:hypothetical protein VL20_1824 [Microcystis panniformis FACHB-1757]|uniref:Uncharacterized protein n=1 Tax=Microcystis panniformis FACHB-1757 TaxID=1638788 RepID=A0A0K1RYJ8_9CHRO|nr:hypothetical protein VL20_1824 [Microcystis panniformis FACHB-1757]
MLINKSDHLFCNNYPQNSQGLWHRSQLKVCQMEVRVNQ